MKPQVSICIPTANLGERSIEYLDCCMQSIDQQDYADKILIVISDHSQDKDIYDYIKQWPTKRSPISYFRNTKDRGSAVMNMNKAMSLVPEDYLVKMLFQDDMLKTPDAITRMVHHLESTSSHWLGVGCDHIDDNDQDMNYPHPPRWVPDLSMAHGRNLIGSPSVVMFRNCDLRMDPELCYLNDCEFYYRMGQQYGPPALLDDILVTIRMRAQGLSSTLNVGEVKSKESLYLQKKFGEV